MRDILTNLAGASEQDLTAVLEFITGRGAELATAGVTADVVEELGEIAAANRGVRAEQARRGAEKSLADRRAEALAELDGTHDPARDHIPDPGPEGTQPPKPDEEAVTPAANEPEETEKPKPARGGSTPKPKTQRSLGDLGIEQPPAAPLIAGTVVAKTRVAANVPGHSAGAELAGDADVVAAFVAKANALNTPNAAGRHDVLRVEFEYPEARQLTASDPVATRERIDATRGPQALTAAGLCLPLETRYDIETIGVTDRPVKAALTGFNTQRGGIQYRAPFDALAMSEGLGVWTQTDDTADPLVPKTCFEVVCPGVLEASIYSTYLCLEFPNMGARFDPQWVRATTESSMVAHARFAENQLWQRLLAGSKAVSTRHVLGAVRDILYNFDKAISYYRYRHRLEDAVPLHGIYPRWLIDMLRADLAMQMTDGNPQELFAIARASLEQWFRTRNVNPSWHLDGLVGATVNGIVIPDQTYPNLAAGAALPEWPGKVDSLLYREGDWLFLDGGTLDLGLVRDSALNLRNRYQTFTETFEGVAFVGIESLRVVFTVVPSGASSGTIDPRAIDATLPAAV